MLILDIIANGVVIAGMFYLTIVMALAGWVAGLRRGQAVTLLPARLDSPLAEMWQAWQVITHAADSYLDTLTAETLQGRMIVEGQPFRYNIGTMLQRVIYHYWFHLGEALAIRQMLGHSDLPEFVGDIQIQAPYRPE